MDVCRPTDFDHIRIPDIGSDRRSGGHTHMTNPNIDTAALRKRVQERLSAARIESDGGAWVSADFLIDIDRALDRYEAQEPKPLNGQPEHYPFCPINRPPKCICKELDDNAIPFG
jgi:hypothetical protein